MAHFSRVEVLEDDNGRVFTLATIEGAADDVACYVLGGEHDDADHVQEYGQKITERVARAQGANWPAHLRYRR